MRTGYFKLLAIPLAGLLVLFITSSNVPEIESITTSSTTATPTGTTTRTSTQRPSNSPGLPKKAELDVAFQVQAPNGNWDPLHEEACEEASLIMVKHFINKTPITQAEENIQALVAYQTSVGLGVSVSLAELVTIAEWFDMKGARIVKNPTADQIKEEIVAGRPVILPAAGRLLENPNFTGEGPLYHMLVVTGYDKNTFITNDPGTRKGEGYEYSSKTIMNALHDWDPNEITNGTPAYLVFDQ